MSLSSQSVAAERAAKIARDNADPAAGVESLRQQIEIEIVRLAACGVVAMANTPESAAKAREMLPLYRSASCDEVAAAVDLEMALRQQLADSQKREATALAACKLKDDALGSIMRDSGLVFLMRVDQIRRSKEALSFQPNDSALKAWLGEHACEAIGESGAPARWWWSDYGLSLPVGTKLYSPKQT